MTLLYDIGLRFGTDKTCHEYLPHYESRFNRKAACPILEIGIAEGTSLLMWRSYFLKAEIIGLDIELPNRDWPPGILALQGSQKDRTFLQSVVVPLGPFYAIIDDGSHNPNDQIVSWDELWPSVEPGGWYVIEDLHMLFELRNKGWVGDSMLDLLHRRNSEFLTYPTLDIAELHLIGGPHNDGLLMLKKTI